MFGLPSARLPKFRAIATGGALLVAILALNPTSATYADPGKPTANLDAVHTQRSISDDFSIDQNLVAALPLGDTDQHIAAVGPAMRPLVPQFNAVWPTRGLITTYYGEVGRLSPRGHSGVDIAAPEGTPVLAADDGEVLKAYWNQDGYGGLVIVGHPSGYETWYGHLDRFDVEMGDQVKRGEQIALMGSTGFSTGPHLHFEVRQDGQVVDPLAFLKEANLTDADW
jgi:murein DD-endopeptidase MepM/ murein hydrolase activator NlpD